MECHDGTAMSRVPGASIIAEKYEQFVSMFSIGDFVAALRRVLFAHNVAAGRLLSHRHDFLKRNPNLLFPDMNTRDEI